MSLLSSIRQQADNIRQKLNIKSVAQKVSDDFAKTLQGIKEPVSMALAAPQTLYSTMVEQAKLRLPSYNSQDLKGTLQTQGGKLVNTAQFMFQNLKNEFDKTQKLQDYQTQQLGKPVLFGQLETPMSRFLSDTTAGQKISSAIENFTLPYASNPWGTKTDIPVGKILSGLVKVSPEVRAVDQKMSRMESLTPSEKKLAQNEDQAAMMGIAMTPAGVENKIAEQPEVASRLRNLLHYPEDLMARGFGKNDIKYISAPKAQEIIDKGLSRQQWFETAADKFKQIAKPGKPAVGKIKSPDEFVQLESVVDDFTRGLDIKVKNKVNWLDYLRTPDRVLEKIGMKPEADLLLKKWSDYKLELPQEINKVTEWSKRIGNNPESDRKIFRWLDGKPQQLQGEELSVAKEIKNYLGGWAERLGLPADKRVTNYITHLFEPDLVQKEFPIELARMIDNKVPGSVYDPFLMKRFGIGGYKESAFQALDAYIKRATRKVNMDPALEKLSTGANNLDLDSAKYVERLGARINLRPTEVDNLIDNWIKSSPIGYKLGQRPTARVTQAQRSMVYRGTLGLNLGSALKNLTQGINTYSQLGEKYTIAGYTKGLRALANGDDELARVGVLADDFIQDRTLNATKKVWEKADKVLFGFFENAEKVNRSSAYYGAKLKALANGKTDEQAIEAGKALVRKTQFTFGSVDTPVALGGDIVKSLAQFQSYNLKQAEFLAELVKSKDFPAIIRFIGATVLTTATVGKALGMDLTDAIPFWGVASGETKLGQTPTIKATGAGLNLLTSADKVVRTQAKKDLLSAGIAHIPGGVQIKKTLQGADLLNKGYSETPSGKLRYLAPDSLLGKLQVITLGVWSTPEAQNYIEDKSGSSESATNLVNELKKKGKSQGEITDILKQIAEVKKEYKKSTDADTTSAEDIFAKGQTMTPDQRAAYLNQLKADGTLTPELLTKLKNMKKTETIKKFPEAMEVQLLPNIKTKAEYIYRRGLNMTAEQRNEYLKALKESGVLTDSLLKELRKQRSGQ